MKKLIYDVSIVNFDSDIIDNISWRDKTPFYTNDPNKIEENFKYRDIEYTGNLSCINEFRALIGEDKFSEDCFIEYNNNNLFKINNDSTINNCNENFIDEYTVIMTRIYKNICRKYPVSWYEW